MIKLNKDLISHIEIHNLHKGIKGNWGTFHYSWLPEEKVKIFGFTLDVLKEGYWLKGSRSFGSCTYDLNESVFDIKGEIWQKPKITIFAGEKKITTKYFETLEEAEQYCVEHFPQVATKL